MTTPNDGSYIDSTGDTGQARYTYQVCEAGTQTCSNEVTSEVPAVGEQPNHFSINEASDSSPRDESVRLARRHQLLSDNATIQFNLACYEHRWAASTERRRT